MLRRRRQARAKAAAGGHRHKPRTNKWAKIGRRQRHGNSRGAMDMFHRRRINSRHIANISKQYSAAAPTHTLEVTEVFADGRRRIPRDGGGTETSTTLIVRRRAECLLARMLSGCDSLRRKNQSCTSRAFGGCVVCVRRLCGFFAHVATRRAGPGQSLVTVGELCWRRVCDESPFIMRTDSLAAHGSLEGRCFYGQGPGPAPPICFRFLCTVL